jgi:cyclic-di-GMP-binding protein
MPSFDIVSTLDLQEVDNAVNQARKELATRYDFRGSKSRIDWDHKMITLLSDDDFRMKALTDILIEKIVRRKIDVKALGMGKVEPTAGGLVKCEITLKQGVPVEMAREIVKQIKDAKLKVQSQIQGDVVRVSGKKRDDLQEAIALVRGKGYDLPLQFVNFRE